MWSSPLRFIVHRAQSEELIFFFCSAVSHSEGNYSKGEKMRLDSLSRYFGGGGVGGSVHRYVRVFAAMCMCTEGRRGHQGYYSIILCIVNLRQVLSLSLKLDWQPMSLRDPSVPALCSIAVKGTYNCVKLFSWILGSVLRV